MKCGTYLRDSKLYCVKENPQLHILHLSIFSFFSVKDFLGDDFPGGFQFSLIVLLLLCASVFVCLYYFPNVAWVGL